MSNQSYSETVPHSTYHRSHLKSSNEMHHPKQSKADKQVTFSDFSEVCVFSISPGRCKQYYTRDDLKLFKSQAALEARRIRGLICEQRLPKGKAIRQVMSRGLLKHDDLLGIEYLVNKNAAEQRSQERKCHGDAVLDLQKFMQEKCSKVDSEKFAKFSSLSSAKSVEQALIRASWSDVVGDKNRKIVKSRPNVSPAVISKHRSMHKSDESIKCPAALAA